MSISINNNNGIIEVSQNGSVPKSYYGAFGKSYPSGKNEYSDYDGFLINLEKDSYDVRWYDLLINGNSPTSFIDASNLLASMFAGNSPTLKVNPITINQFDIRANEDFTIEWLQYMHTDYGFPRIYSIGQNPAQNSIYIENGVLYLWLNGDIASSAILSGYLNTWVHIVVTRKDNVIYVWGNGTNLIAKNYFNAILANGLDFYIGSENAPNTYYNGLISNFRWNYNFAVYGIDSPAYPTVPLDKTSESILLIGQGDDLFQQLTDQTGLSTITNTYCTYNADSGISGFDGSIQFGTI